MHKIKFESLHYINYLKKQLKNSWMDMLHEIQNVNETKEKDNEVEHNSSEMWRYTKY